MRRTRISRLDRYETRRAEPSKRFVGYLRQYFQESHSELEGRMV
jgi:hypothetical protein